MYMKTYLRSYVAHLFLGRKMFQTKVVEKKKTHFLLKIYFFENHVVYEIMRKNMVEQGRAQMVSIRVRFLCWIIKSIDTHSEYVILAAFQLQKCLYESVSMLHLYVHCLSWGCVRENETGECQYDIPVRNSQSVSLSYDVNCHCSRLCKYVASVSNICNALGLTILCNPNRHVVSQT